ncbi:MAG TPA: hypothetical protein VMD92_11020 [Acidobacteriaceae bacterium]|nr:hypothetical protein [Acidobacteriaceae bacterium]
MSLIVRRLALAAAFLALAPFFLLHAQTEPAAPAQAVAAPAAESCPATATLDKLIAAIDAAITGPASKDRTCFRQLMLPEVRLIPVNGATGAKRVLTVDDWIAAVAKNGDAMVTERQLKVQSETFGRIAHLWSTYETTLAGKPRARGINSIQAVFDGQNWHVLEIVWQAESPDTPIPAKDLP